MKNKTESSTSSFHSRLLELEKIYHLIQESEERDLERIITLYEKGMKLAAGLEKTITEYEMRIEEVQVNEDEQGTLQNGGEERTHSAEKTSMKTPLKKTQKHYEKTPETSAETQKNLETSFELFSTQ